MRDLARRFVPRGRIAGVVLAFFFVTSALAVTLALQQIAERAYFILFVPAVMFSTWFGGHRAGLLASALTVVATIYLLPRAELADQLVWLVVAGLVTFGTSALTDRRRRVEEVLAAQAREEQSRRYDAEALSQLKTDLLAQVAHELRQPLSAMTMALGLIEVQPDEGARRRALGVVARQTDQLRRLVDDLLDASRISRREIQLRKSQIDLCEVAEDSLHMVANDIAARRVGVSSSLPQCPVHVTADPIRIRQVVSNLLSNAVKFTPEGGHIDLSVERTASLVVIRVRDTGCGIAPERLSRIFDMFHKAIQTAQGSASASRW